jgi:hypothetical protein
VGVSAQKPKHLITVENTSKFNRSELVRVSWADVLKVYPTIDTANFQVINKATAGQLPYQLEKTGRCRGKVLVTASGYQSQK